MKSRTVSIPGFIHAKPARSWEDPIIDGMVVEFFRFKEMDSCGYTLVCRHVLAFDVPARWDPRSGQVKILEAEKLKVRADFAARITDLDRQLSELKCLEMV